MTNDSTAHLTTARPAMAVIPERLRTAWSGRPLPVHPLLVAAYPVLFLSGVNLGELELSDLFGPLVAVVGAALLLLVIGAAVLRDSRRAALVVSAVAAMLLLYGHVAGVLAPRGVQAAFQQIGWAVFVFAAG